MKISHDDVRSAVIADGCVAKRAKNGEPSTVRLIFLMKQTSIAESSQTALSAATRSRSLAVKGREAEALQACSNKSCSDLQTWSNDVFNKEI